MEDQICKAYNAVLDHFNRKENASTGNLIIQGEQGCGKTMLATSFIKVLQKMVNSSQERWEHLMLPHSIKRMCSR